MAFLKITKSARQTMMSPFSGVFQGYLFVMLCGGTRVSTDLLDASIGTSPGSVKTAINGNGGIHLAELNFATTGTGSWLYDNTRGVLAITDTGFIAATTAGQATWFIALVTNSSQGSDGALFTGSISDLAGDGDLRVPNTNIVLGQQYRTGRMELTLPYEFNF